MKAIELIDTLHRRGFTPEEIAREILRETPSLDIRAKAGDQYFDEHQHYVPPPQVLATALLEGTPLSELEIGLAEFNLYWQDREEGRPVFAHQLFLRHLQNRRSYQ